MTSHGIRRSVTNAWLSMSAHGRLIICSLIGLACGAFTARYSTWDFALLVFWDVTALSLLVTQWHSLRSFSSAETREFATREDPGRGSAHLILIAASVVSLGAVVVLLIHPQSNSQLQELVRIFLGVASVVISWAMIHSLYALRYADLYFKEAGGVDFNNSKEPSYTDFAYLAFTIGMTYQVSDTSLRSVAFRRMAISHALLSYLFGTAIIATTINLVVSLGK